MAPYRYTSKPATSSTHTDKVIIAKENNTISGN